MQRHGIWHLLTQSVNSRVQISVSVLSVHIVSSGSGVVFDPHAKVLHVSAVLLRDLNTKRAAMSNRYFHSINLKLRIRLLYIIRFMFQ